MDGTLCGSTGAPARVTLVLMTLQEIVDDYGARFQARARAELDAFRKEPTLEAAVRRACLTLDSKGRRESHHRRRQISGIGQHVASANLQHRGGRQVMGPTYRQVVHRQCGSGARMDAALQELISSRKRPNLKRT